MLVAMEERLVRLEDFALEATERLARSEARLDALATKADLAALRVEMHKGFADMIKWIVGTAIVLGATAITVITFVLNNATLKALLAPPAPIVIQVPVPVR
jgi:hypothetical protein